jgi:hypothetical protein
VIYNFVVPFVGRISYARAYDALKMSPLFEHLSEKYKITENRREAKFEILVSEYVKYTFSCVALNTNTRMNTCGMQFSGVDWSILSGNLTDEETSALVYLMTRVRQPF